MAAIDSGVLVQLLVEENLHDARKAEAFLEKERPLWISTVVLSEAFRVLPLVHDWNKAQVLAALRGLLDSKDFALQSPEVVRASVDLYAAARTDFQNCLAVELASTEGVLPFGTFSRETSSLPGATGL